MADNQAVLSIVQEGRNLMNRLEALTVDPVPVPPPPPPPPPPPSGLWSDVAARMKAGKITHLGQDTITLTAPVTITLDQVLDDGAFGISGNHTLIQCSGFTGPAITIIANKLCRGLVLENFTLKGGGIKLVGVDNLYACWLSNLRVEGAKGADGHGIWCIGSVFEADIVGPKVFDCEQDGLRFEHTARICSAVTVHGGVVAQNRVGIGLRNNCRDVVLLGTYLRDNRVAGAELSNGHDRKWVSCGWENNGPANHIYALNNVLIDGHSFHDKAGTSAAVRISTVLNPSAIRDSRRTGSGSGLVGGPVTVEGGKGF